ncbi:hypothetical protein [Archaeoglobus neptunius]|uniref:hypothetical protein n=1 Tax=Archaeoglobus neptunius TaxID=2798580 RepID=UPI001927E9C3|nr:hypothetical protein [Archaeoglobus neptunius]
MIQISRDELEKIIEEKLREVLLKMFMEIMPYVTDEEQREIDRMAGSPENFDEKDFEPWNGE